MSNYELYTKDTRVWIPDPDKVWKAARLLQDLDAKSSTIKLIVEEDQREIDYDISSSSSSSSSSSHQEVPNPKLLPPLRNPDILIGQNDLTALSHLNEPEVLYNLEVRFLNSNQIYTYCGIVLVAINPYEQLSIYGNEIIQMYSNGRDVQNMDPHIFAVSEQAFQQMVHYEQNQSIIVSGESGAGKTVSAKYTMRYFANVGGSSEETQVEKKVLASSPIMEAFGNAKTTRNDNSSRFGKFIQIDFNRVHHIVGGSMKTYLLEKSRVVFQAQQERNYHIFYQLCAQRNKRDYAYLKLSSASEYVYTNQGDAETIDNVDDNRVFLETLEAFRLLEITETQQATIFCLISAIMHLGNVRLVSEKTNESSCVSLNDPAIKTVCELLKINEGQMRAWLCMKRIKTVTETVNTPLPLSQALFSRDALAKHMYSQLFNWIVAQINSCLRSPVKSHSFIGVLDIYGFETFETNSFEQFCINYANEKLQQQFCQHVFKLEQEEYLREQIKWSFIEFYDNQPCIELIEGKLGILDLLDEECKMPKGSDGTWCGKLYDKHLKAEKQPPPTQTSANLITPQHHFSKPRMSQTAFNIHHFAEKVQYQIDGFLEKNRDTVLEEQLRVLKNSEIDFIAEMFSEDTDLSSSSKSKGYEVKKTNTLLAPSKTQTIRKKTVGSQFRESLNHLMTALNSTTPHYVRCIKPNDSKAPFKFESKRAVEQLRACGVLETVRISAAGYPSRWTYHEFFQRYRILVSSKLIDRKQLRQTCEQVLMTLIHDHNKYQFGKTKIFFQAGQVAYLEKLRSEKLKTCGIMIQKHVRGWLARSRYTKIKKSTLLIQCHARGLIARRLLKFKRESRSALLIQTNWRSFICRRKFLQLKRKTISMQTLCRGYLARKNRDLRVKNAKAVVIQAQVRGWLARRRFKKIIYGFTLLQAHFRRRKARKLFKTLKIEARSVDHQRQLNKGLENKIISLQQQIVRINKERDALSSKASEMESYKAQVLNLKQSTHIVKESNIKIHDLSEELTKVRENYDLVKNEKQQLIKSKDQIERDLKEVNGRTSSEIKHLQTSLEAARAKIIKLEGQIDEMKTQLNELANERENHQKLIKEYAKLEQRFEKVRSELLRYGKQQQQQQQHKEQQQQQQQMLGSNGSSSSSTTSFNQHNSELESLIEELEQDTKLDVMIMGGSGSGSCATSIEFINNGVANFENNKLLYMTNNGSEMDVSLISKLNRRIASLEMEKRNLSNKPEQDNNNNVNDLSESEKLEKIQQEKDYEMIKSQELEFENQKLREDLTRLRDFASENNNNSNSQTSDSLISREMINQYEALSDEVQRRRDECIQLKSLLIAKHRATFNATTENNNKQQNGDETAAHLDDISSLNTDGNEFEVGYNTQKILNRILENQMYEMKRDRDVERAARLKELTKLRDEYERSQSLLMQNLSPDNLAEATYKNEIVKLVDANLELSEKCDNHAEQVKKYKKMLKIYMKRARTSNFHFDTSSSRYNTGGGPLNSSSLASVNGFAAAAATENDKSIMSAILNNTLTNSNGTHAPPPPPPQIKSKNSGEFMGIFEWKCEDEATIVTKLMEELKPRLAVTFLPGLPAYALFMCIRYADMLNDDERVRSLLNSSVQSVKRLIKRKQEDLEYVVLWMTNFCRLIHNLKQYSGESAFQIHNAKQQNEHCLKNFDLAEYRGILSDIAIWLFQGIIKDFEKKLNPIIVPAMLEHESLPGINESSKLNSTINNKSLNNSKDEANKSIEKSTIDSLIKKLNEFLKILNSHGIDPEIVNQIFKQIFYFIGANTFNNLILRKEMCHWSKGIELRYNISFLEQWIRDSKLQESGASETLEPVIQASQLLQARKSDSDIKSICDMCPKLTIAQIQRILFMYTPVEAYEEKLTRQFIDKVTNNLKELRATEDNSAQQILILDTQKQYPICIPFNPSNIGLETIELPEQLNMNGLLKKI